MRAGNAPDIRYTVKDDALFAIVLGTWSGGEVVLRSLGASAPVQGTIANVTMLGHPGRLAFKRTDDGLKVTLPTPATTPPYAYVLKIAGLKMNPSTATESENPQ